MLKRRTLVYASLATGLVAGLAGLAEVASWDEGIGPLDGAGWRPIAWPFPRDAFTPGRAWRGHDLEVYVRPKLGLCSNCETGIVTDEELERVSDLDLFDRHFAPLQDGRRVRITDLFGRARLYRLKLGSGAVREAEAIAVSHKCDLVVAVVVGRVRDEAARKTAHRFIESNTVQVWVNRLLDGR